MNRITLSNRTGKLSGAGVIKLSKSGLDGRKRLESKWEEERNFSNVANRCYDNNGTAASSRTRSSVRLNLREIEERQGKSPLSNITTNSQQDNVYRSIVLPPSYPSIPTSCTGLSRSDRCINSLRIVPSLFLLIPQPFPNPHLEPCLLTHQFMICSLDDL